MSRALVEEARRRGADVLLAAGDLSAGGGPRDVATARRILDGFGTLGRDYLVVRGNHDRPPVHWADPFGDTFTTTGTPATSPTTSAGCASSASTPTTRRATAATRAAWAPSNCRGSRRS